MCVCDMYICVCANDSVNFVVGDSDGNTRRGPQPQQRRYMGGLTPTLHGFAQKSLYRPPVSCSATQPRVVDRYPRLYMGPGK